jgi:hypothetical protein
VKEKKSQFSNLLGKTSNNCLHTHWFFYNLFPENCQFFDSNPPKPGTSSSLILKYFKNWNQQLLKTSRYLPNTGKN